MWCGVEWRGEGLGTLRNIVFLRAHASKCPEEHHGEHVCCQTGRWSAAVNFPQRGGTRGTLLLHPPPCFFTRGRERARERALTVKIPVALSCVR